MSVWLLELEDPERQGSIFSVSPPLPHTHSLVGTLSWEGEESSHLPFPVEASMVTIRHIEGVSPSEDLSLELL
jgi:hypothetical protein